MANLYIFWDGRSPRKDGTGTLKLALTHKHKTIYESLGIRVKKDEWDSAKYQVVSRPDKKFHNVFIRKRFSEAQEALERIEKRSDFPTLTARDILTMIIRGTDTADTLEAGDYVLPVYNEYIALCRKGTTASIYRTSLNNLKEYEDDIDSLRFRDINVAWLRKYQQWLTDSKGMEVNGANVYLRNLRTVFNYALKNELTSARYPFKDIDMSTTEPNKTEIPYKKFLEWVIEPEIDQRVLYRDLFMLSFFLCGMRPWDLLHVRKDQIEEGRLVYWPEKLNGRTKLSIKIEPEAWALIHKYEGKELMLNILEEREDYKTFCRSWNKGLRMIGYEYGPMAKTKDGRPYRSCKRHGVVPYITAYYARTCWGTYQYNILNTPMDIISQAYGHKSGLRVTNFYVKRAYDKVDKVNRDLITRVTEDIKKAKDENSAA